MQAGAPAPLPDYGGACLSSVIPAILGREQLSRDGRLPGFLPEPLAAARQVVLLVLDGLGYDQLRERAGLAPVLSSLEGGAITSVAPTTTASALTSIVTGTTPAEHGVLGYRIRVGSEVLNVLRWTTRRGDARARIAPSSIQSHPAFGGAEVPMVVRAEFAGSGFTEAQAPGGHLVGWTLASSIPVEVAAALAGGARFVYAYYDGIDKIAHARGLGAHYEAELAATDRLVAEVLARLPAGAVLAVTADHGQVEVREPAIVLEASITALCTGFSGEGRFRWLHARAGAVAELAQACTSAYGELAWVATRDELVASGYFGGPLRGGLAERLGDVALIASAPVAFADPDDDGEQALVARHGSLTDAEIRVPFLVGSR